MIAAMSDRRTRAEQRRQRAVLRKTTLHAIEDDIVVVRGAEAVSLVHRLTVMSWSLASRTLPEYTRDRIPCRFVSWATKVNGR